MKAAAYRGETQGVGEGAGCVVYRLVEGGNEEAGIHFYAEGSGVGGVIRRTV